MITQEQIGKAANDAYGRHCEAETSGFITGAEWAVEQMLAENERLRAAIKAAIKEASSEPDANDALFLVVETLRKAIEE